VSLLRWSLLSGAVSLVAASGAMGAPFQCASDPDPSKAREEGPGEALYGLAEQFRQRGDEKARADTLRFIVTRYPKSRFAVMAREDLEKMGAPAPAP
jgi:hypothetical protein